MKIECFHSGSKGNLYRLTPKDGAPLIIECGVPLPAIKKALRFRLSEVCGCFLTHAHKDHSCSAQAVMDAGIDLYASRETSEALGLSSHRLRLIAPGEQFTIGSWRVVPFTTDHDCPGSVGFLLGCEGEKILFATDTASLPHRFEGLTRIAIEVNWSDQFLKPDTDSQYWNHMSLETALEFLERTDLKRVKEIMILHVSSANGDAESFAGAIMRATGIPVRIAGRR